MDKESQSLGRFALEEVNFKSWCKGQADPAELGVVCFSLAVQNVHLPRTIWTFRVDRIGAESYMQGYTAT